MFAHRSTDERQLDKTYANMGNDKVEAIQAVVKQSLIESLRGVLFDQIHSAVVESRENIFEQVESEFKQISKNIGKSLNVQIGAVRDSHTQLITTQKEQSLSFKQMKSAYKEIKQKLKTHMDTICEAVINRTLSDREIQDLSDHRAVFLAREADAPPDIINIIDVGTSPDDELERSPTLSLDTINARLMQAVEAALGLDPIDPGDGNLSEVSTELASMIGLGIVKTRILELIAYQATLKQRQQSGLSSGLSLSLHLVFTGNPGTGKTTVADIVGKMYRRLGLLRSGKVLQVGRSDLVGAYIGHTERKVQQVMEKACDGVLFIDEAYTLVQGTTNHDFGRIALDEIMRYMEIYRDRLAVVVAGYPKEMQTFLEANPGLMSRFPQDNVIFFPDYSPEELQLIFDQFLSTENYQLSDDMRISITQIIETLYHRREETFGNAREMRNLMDALVRRHSFRIQKAGLSVDEPIRPEDINEHYQQFDVARAKSANGATKTPLEQINDMIGLRSVKIALKRLVDRARLNTLLDKPVQANSLHMLFRGAPGTGKTTVAEKMGQVLKDLGYLKRGHVILASRATLVGQHIGESERKTKDLLKQATGGVLFIDEAYSLNADGSGQDFGRRVIDELVAYLDKYRDRLVVILAGYPDELDALVDSNPGLRGRFRNPIDFKNYTQDELLHICRKMAASEGQRLNAAAEEKVLAYWERERTNEPDSFDNARAVRRLLDEMVGRLSERLVDIEDKAEAQLLASQFVAEDVPPPPAVKAPKKHRSSRSVLVVGRGDRPTAKPLSIDIISPAADQFR